MLSVIYPRASTAPVSNIRPVKKVVFISQINMSDFNIYIKEKGTHIKVCGVFLFLFFCLFGYRFSLWAVFQLVLFNVCLGKKISISTKSLVKLVEANTLTLTF